MRLPSRRVAASTTPTCSVRGRASGWSCSTCVGTCSPPGGRTGSAARSSEICVPAAATACRRGEQRSRPFRVLRAGRQPGALLLSADQKLEQGLNYVKMRDGVELAMTVRLPAGQDARRRAVPDPHRVLGLPGRGSARPARLDTRRHVRSARPGDLDGRRLADRTAARLRRGERADARLGLLGRRLRPLRPSDHLRRLRRRRDRRRAELGEGRQGRDGRHLLLGDHASSSWRERSRRTWPRSRRCR